MKAQRTGLFALVLLALMVSESYALSWWVQSYLEGVDELILLAWRNIYYYTWLILPRWIMCAYFYDTGSRLFDFTQTEDDDTLKEICYEGVKQYYQATMYGGNIDNMPYAYFRSFYREDLTT